MPALINKPESPSLIQFCALSPADCRSRKLGIGLARDGVVHGHFVGFAGFDVLAVGLGEGQDPGVGIRPGLETGAAVPQLDRGADFG